MTRGLRRLIGLGICTAVILTALSGVAAVHEVSPMENRIYLNYGPFEFSAGVEALERFAQDGTVDEELGFILNRFSPERQAQIRGLLNLRHKVSPVIVSRVGYANTTERLLQWLGQMVQTGDRQNGFYAIRAALVLAAADPDGLSLINVLKKFPTDVRIDIAKVINFSQEIKTTIRETDQIVAELEAETTKLAQAKSLENQEIPDLSQPGTWQYQQETLNLKDASRDRPLTIDVYRPVVPGDETDPTPVIMVSGGLGAQRSHFAYLAEHLASQGFAVVLLDHPGSNDKRQRDFFKGLYRDNFDSRDFIDRPLDVTFVLNELEKRNPEFDHPLNLKQVGMFGYSWGGTAALALAGAEINFEQLEQECGSNLDIVNIAVLYQCRALELPHQTYQLKDDRIQAIFLFVPSSRHVYGAKELAAVRVPIFWQATNEDLITPLILEHVPMFKAAGSTEKYLAVSQGLPHTRVILGLLDRVTGANRSQSSEQLFNVTQSYLKTFNSAFFQTYINHDKDYQSYLTAAYAQAVTQKPYTLSLVRSVP
jgi:predicted dienelactone hydrolase